METVAPNVGGGREPRETTAATSRSSSSSYGGKREPGCGGHYFQMPLHYPRYSKEDYDAMPEWQLDRLLSEYGLPVAGNHHQKRNFAKGAFLWGAGAGGNN